MLPRPIAWRCQILPSRRSKLDPARVPQTVRRRRKVRRKKPRLSFASYLPEECCRQQNTENDVQRGTDHLVDDVFGLPLPTKGQNSPGGVQRMRFQHLALDHFLHQKPVRQQHSAAGIFVFVEKTSKIKGDDAEIVLHAANYSEIRKLDL